MHTLRNMPTDLKECFISLDGYIQQVREGMSVEEAERLRQSLIHGMIDVMSVLAKPKLEELFNRGSKEPDC